MTEPKDECGTIATEGQVESQPGAGTKFTVWLPLKPPVQAELAA